MTCPKIDRLLKVFVDGIQDDEVEAHVVDCPDCRAYVTLFEEVPSVFEPDISVPKALLERTAANLPAPGEETNSGGFPFLTTLVSGILGLVTAMCVLFVAGAAESGTPHQLLLTSLGVGAATMGLKATRGWGQRPGEWSPR